MSATYPAHYILLDLITPITFGEEYDGNINIDKRLSRSIRFIWIYYNRSLFITIVSYVIQDSDLNYENE
jgi:hypothetical protein